MTVNSYGYNDTSLYIIKLNYFFLFLLKYNVILENSINR